MRLRTSVPGLLLAATFALAGCSATETVSIRVALRDDASATVVVTRIMMAEDEAMPEADVVQWRKQAKVVGSVGRVDAFEQVTIEGIQFVLVTSPVASGDDEQHIRVEVPTGPDAAWAKSMTIADEEERDEMRGMLSDTMRREAPVRIGEDLMIVIDMPSNVTWNSLSPTAWRYPRSIENTTASITIPLDQIQRESRPLVWRVGWDQAGSD